MVEQATKEVSPHPSPNLKTTQPKRKRRSKEETRALLLDAAEAIIRENGVGSINTVSVTTRAGFAQSAFYMHFANVDECLEETGERIAKKIRHSVASESRRMQKESLGEFTAELQFYNFILQLFDEQGVAEIILKNRFDSTPLGHIFNKLIGEMRRDLFEDLWNVARKAGVALEFRDRCEIISDFLFANALAAGEALIEGRITDRDLLSSQLTMTMRATCEDLFRHTQGESS